MNTVNDGEICVAGDCVSFGTPAEKLLLWPKQYNLQRIDATDNNSYFATIENAEYCGTPVKVVMAIDRSGLRSFSLPRSEWMAIGNSIADYNSITLRGEYLKLSSLVEKEVGRQSDRVATGESIWNERIFNITTRYELIAFEVGIFFSRNN